MPLRRLAVLLALAGCGSGSGACAQVGAVSQLTVRLPAGVTTGQACVQGVCTTTVQNGALLVPLGRREEGGSALVTVTLPGRQASYEGEVPLLRTRPNGPRCPPVAVTGVATVDLAAGRVVPG